MANKNPKEKKQIDERYHNGKLRLEYCDFVVDKETKEEFLNSIVVESTREQCKILLLKLDYFENKVNKRAYNFSADDVQNFISTGVCYSSVKSMSTAISRISKYVDYCVEKNLGMINNFKLFKFEKSDLLNFSVIQNRYITEEQLHEYVDALYNISDKLILELFFLGMTFEEAKNLKKNDVKFHKAEIHVRSSQVEKRIIKNVPKRILNLLSDNETTTEYIANNNQKILTDSGERKPRKGKIVKTSYVFSQCAKREMPDEPVGHMFFSKRIAAIQKVVANLDITPSSIRTSGIINEVKKRKKKQGVKELNLENCIQIYTMFHYVDHAGDNKELEAKTKKFIWNIENTIKEIEKAKEYTE